MGAGLGLAIVQMIADAHDAKVAARAEPRGGLRIDIRFLVAPKRHGGWLASTIATGFVPVTTRGG